MKTLKVEDVMTSLVVKLYPNDTIHDAAGRLAQNDISGAPVVAEGKVVGIVSEADLMRCGIGPAPVGRGWSTLTLIAAFLRGHVTSASDDITVGSIMSSYVVTISPTASVWQAASVMDRHGVKRLPVTDDEGYLLGIISRSDLIAVMAKTDDALRRDVLDAIAILGSEPTDGIRVQVEDAVVTLRGQADRRTTRDLAIDLARNVAGIIEVVDRLDFEFDDTKKIPHEKDPWAVGPLVKGMAS